MLRDAHAGRLAELEAETRAAATAATSAHVARAESAAELHALRGELSSTGKRHRRRLALAYDSGAAALDHATCALRARSRQRWERVSHTAPSWP